MEKSIIDVMICPDCNSDNCYSFDVDEIDFDTDNTGHYNIDCRCKDCGKIFRIYTKFKYTITDARTR